MKLTYGNGEVLLDGRGKGFEMRYKGSMKITQSPDNLFVSANKSKVVGIMLSDADMPYELFNYEGELRVLSCKVVTPNLDSERASINVQGVDYWELDNEKWEDDGSLWGTRGGTYLVGSPQRFNKKNIVVNKNLKTQSDGQYLYEDGSPVLRNQPIHIMNDGSTMTGAEHSEGSVYIYPPKDRKPITKRQISQIKQVATTGSTGGY